jgi:tRNA nucleotidyltransferase (CCA-adding enzyme)
MNIQLPKKVNLIIHRLMEEGYEAYAVGGCVRDSILGRIPDDWDITTSAKPEQVKELFSHTIDTGIEHGTVTVMLDKEGFEVTTYRVDGMYEDHRHPKEVIFTPHLKDDLMRRDFTINAMAYNDETGIVDCFSGIEDLQKQVVRCVGEPKERFQEDALRMLRAVRFSAQLGFSIDKYTKAAIEELAKDLVNISEERIQAEFVKLLISEHPENILTAYALGITSVILPEFDDMMHTPQNNPYHDKCVGDHVVHAMRFIESSKVLRLTMLLHDVGKPKTKSTDKRGIDHFYSHGSVGEAMAKKILKRLKFDNETLKRVTRLIRWHDYRMEETSRGVRRALHKAGEDIFEDLLKVMRADTLAKSPRGKEKKIEYLEHIENLYHGILMRKECVTLKDLAVTGRDLIALGMKPGKQVGEMLNFLLADVIENPSHNNNTYLTELIKSRLSGCKKEHDFS